MDADMARRDRANGRNSLRLMVMLTAIVAASLFVALSAHSSPAAGDTQTATEPVFQAQASRGACDLYRGVVFKTGRKGIGKVALRRGRADTSSRSGFGVRHIRDDHDTWTAFKFRAMRYIVNNAPITSKGNGKVVLTGRYAENGNTPKGWRLVISRTKGQCPNKDLPTGVVTFHRKG